MCKEGYARGLINPEALDFRVASGLSSGYLFLRKGRDRRVAPARRRKNLRV
jgi:hypothetical protein